ncbi:MDR/zinc-dependent alcohol dehydrogenase-like family protein [Paraburkholderia ferrariae]|uniref:hypothetical protein n=1 Tax=Paraburkholderia ferrariae TaxID=386056 RepID=UPI0004842C6D|nr:hypothetical protein [Paraburkholderia ferrariae]
MKTVICEKPGRLEVIERPKPEAAPSRKYALISIVDARIGFPGPGFHKRETTLLASRHAMPVDFGSVLDARRAGKIPASVPNPYRLESGSLSETFPRLLEPEAGVIKALVVC